MVRCPICAKITRYNGKNCLECGYKYSTLENVRLAEDEKKHKSKMTLRLKLKDRAFMCDFMGTLCMVLALLLIGPAFINLVGYFRAEKRLGAEKLSDYAEGVLVKGVVYSTLVVLLFAACIILFWVKRKALKKTQQLRNI